MSNDEGREMQEQLVEWRVGSKMSPATREKADRARTGILFAPGVGNKYVADPPKQTCPFWCSLCGGAEPTFEAIRAHRCGGYGC